MKALVLLLAILPLSGCLIRSSHPVASRMSTATLKDATRDQLVDVINAEANGLQSFIANVDVDFSAGGEKKGKVTDYAELSGYVLVRKPEMLRMFMQAPVVRSRVFDMASNGSRFAVSVPPKNQFFVGSNQIGKPSDNAIENLRPQVIMDALLIKRIDPENEIAVLENGTELVKDPHTHKTVEQPTYIITVIRKSQSEWVLSRKISFSRDTLLPHEQFIYDHQGDLVTYARYENVSSHDGVMFPDIIDVQRPIEELNFRLAITKLRLNETIQDDQFVLQQPPGSKLVDLDEKNASAARAAQDALKDPQ